MKKKTAYLLVPGPNKKTHPPYCKDVAQVIHDTVEFVLQLLEEVTRLQIELEKHILD